MPEQPHEPIVPQRALVIVAHPDDAELACGATVATWTASGAQVWTCIVTDASGGGDDHAEDVGPAARAAISAMRKAEQRAACDALGQAGALFLDYPDGRIEPTLELRRDIVRVIRQLQPEIIITQSPDRRWDPFFLFRHHPDHLAVGAAVMAAVYPAARNSWDFPELLDEGLKPHRVQELWISAAPVVNHWVDVTAGVDAKIAALRAHHSQLGPRMDELATNIRRWLAENGARYGVGAAEEFHRADLR
ncbi:MAG: PIG-L family deacetylase [Chloroflexi bacterium]|nr:MAG: PIG-L family deacetylase [Chloroflexota bacterium]